MLVLGSVDGGVILRCILPDSGNLGSRPPRYGKAVFGGNESMFPANSRGGILVPTGTLGQRSLFLNGNVYFTALLRGGIHVPVPCTGTSTTSTCTCATCDTSSAAAPKHKNSNSSGSAIINHPAVDVCLLCHSVASWPLHNTPPPHPGLRINHIALSYKVSCCVVESGSQCDGQQR